MTQIECVVIPADIDEPLRIETLDRGDLSAMQKLVGGYISAITLDEPEVTIWNHDDAKLVGSSMNIRATLLWWVGDNRFINVDAISGDVFLTGIPDEEGETTALPQETIDLILATSEYKHQVLTFGGGDWAGNAKRFDDFWDALHDVLCLKERWALVEYTRVVAA